MHANKEYEKLLLECGMSEKSIKHLSAIIKRFCVKVWVYEKWPGQKFLKVIIIYMVFNTMEQDEKRREWWYRTALPNMLTITTCFYWALKMKLPPTEMCC
jgi:hypothetical protein